MPQIRLEENKYQKLQNGQSGEDHVSSGFCNQCGTEAGDWGISYYYEWIPDRHGWVAKGFCNQCGYRNEFFVPGEKE